MDRLATYSFLALLALACSPALAQVPGLDDQLPPLNLPQDPRRPAPLPELPDGGSGFDNTQPDFGDPGNGFDESPGTAIENGGFAEETETLQPFEGEESGFFDDVMRIDYLAPVFSSGEWMDCCCWYTELDFPLMHRTVGEGSELGQDFSPLFFNPGAAARQILTDNAGFRIEPGARITLGRFLGRDSVNRDTSVEVSFLGFYEWTTGSNLAAFVPGQLFSEVDPIVRALPPNTPPNFFSAAISGFNFADYQVFRYTGDLNSLEVNVRLSHRLKRDRLVAMPDGTWSQQLASGAISSYFFGWRWLNVQENLDWISRQGTPDNQVDSSIFGGDYNVETHNDLIGFQIGGDWRWVEKSWQIGVRGKGGGYVNFGDISRRILAVDAARPFADLAIRGRQRDEVMGVAIELGFFAAYHFNPHIAIRASYDALWINGLALATEQVTFEPSRARIDLAGNTYFQAITTGLEVVW